MTSRIKRLAGGLGASIVAAPMLALVLLTSQPAVAHLQATPGVADADGQSIHRQVSVPSGYDCMLQPLGLLDVLATLNKVERAQYDGRIGTIPVTALTRGDDLSEDDALGIEWTMYQLVACANGLDPLRVLPLLSSNMQASLVSNAINSTDWDEVVGALPLLATDVTEQGGLPALDIVTAWYPTGTNKSIDAIVEVPITPESGAAPPQFLVTFVYAERMWVIDRIWLIES